MRNKVSDSAASLQALFSGFFAFIAPIISGSMADRHGFKSATNLMAGIAIASGLIFLLSIIKN
jgi:MFS family permease